MKIEIVIKSVIIFSPLLFFIILLLYCKIITISYIINLVILQIGISINIYLILKMLQCESTDVSISRIQNNVQKNSKLSRRTEIKKYL